MGDDEIQLVPEEGIVKPLENLMDQPDLPNPSGGDIKNESKSEVQDSDDEDEVSGGVIELRIGEIHLKIVDSNCKNISLLIPQCENLLYRILTNMKGNYFSSTIMRGIG